MRAASGHDDARQSLFLDVVLNQFLAEVRTHELVVARDCHLVQVLTGPFSDFFHVDLASDVAAAMAHIDADFLGHRHPPFRNGQAGLAPAASR